MDTLQPIRNVYSLYSVSIQMCIHGINKNNWCNTAVVLDYLFHSKVSLGEMARCWIKRTWVKVNCKRFSDVLIAKNFPTLFLVWPDLQYVWTWCICCVTHCDSLMFFSSRNRQRKLGTKLQWSTQFFCETEFRTTHTTQIHTHMHTHTCNKNTLENHLSDWRGCKE